MQKPKRRKGSQETPGELCGICQAKDPVSRCDGCGRSLCKRCRSIHVYGSKSLEVTIKYYCPACVKDPKINPSTGNDTILGLEDITDMVNQDHTKTGKFKIKLKIS